MPWSGGTFTRTNGVFSGLVVWLQDKLAGTKITTQHHDTHDQDLASGINNCMAKDGQNAATGNMNLGGYKIINLSNGADSSDAAAITQLKHFYAVQVVAETVALSAGTTKLTFRMPHAMTISAVYASLAVAQTSGSIVTIDVNRLSGTFASIFSTRITIDNGSRTSVGAATPAVIERPDMAFDTEMTVDIDQIGDGTAVGLRLTFLGQFS